MGYPMTFKRFINRNNLRGDYGAKVSLINLDAWPRVPNDGSDIKGVNLRWLADEIDSLNQKWSLIQGDLRRLEQDAIDEKTVCLLISKRSGVDVELVAAVLKEFLDL